nr:hypothetical protein [Chromatium okenii]
MNEIPQDQALERDVQLFTALLGEVLREHSRKRVLVIVERLRDGLCNCASRKMLNCAIN